MGVVLHVSLFELMGSVFLSNGSISSWEIFIFKNFIVLEFCTGLLAIFSKKIKFSEKVDSFLERKSRSDHETKMALQVFHVISY